MLLFFHGRQSTYLGVVILAFGLIWFLSVLDLMPVDPGQIFQVFWPLLLIIWGMDALVGDKLFSIAGDGYRYRGRIERTGGLFVTVLGLLILGRNLGLYDLDLSILWRLFWPLVIIFLGWSLVTGTRERGRPGYAIMSGIEVKEEGWKLENKNYLAFMGGIDLDLGVADIPEGDVYLGLTAVMGGIDIKVPEDMYVECTATSVLGGVDFFHDGSGGIISSRRFEHPGSGDTKSRLFIRCRTLMGGVDVRGV